MFEGLNTKLGAIFDRLGRRGVISEGDITDALREARVALLEADVALSVVKDFTVKVKERALGQDVLRSVAPGQQVIKIAHDALLDMLGTTAEPLNINVAPPAVVLMLGLQGSGKTTTAAKVARFLQGTQRRKVLLASLDVRRPAAQEQLAVLAEHVGVASLPIVPGQDPLGITRRALQAARQEGFDVLILDTAGRLAVDEDLMAEAAAIRDLAQPHEKLLVLDAMTGQDALTTATHFHAKVGVTGLVLTRLDGDARGGAALSLRAVTGCPIKFLGTGEKVEALEVYHPDRLADRILGMGDVVSLVEKAAATVDKTEAEAMATKMFTGGFDLNDLAKQLRQVRKMGGLSSLLGFLPGVGKIKDQLKAANVDDRVIARQEAIILSMTLKERRDASLLGASRKRRIAKGAGVEVQDVNRLLKQFFEMEKTLRQVRRKMGPGGLAGLMGGGVSDDPDKVLARLKRGF